MFNSLIVPFSGLILNVLIITWNIQDHKLLKYDGFVNNPVNKQ